MSADELDPWDGLEERLYAQEHRLFWIFLNFWGADFSKKSPACQRGIRWAWYCMLASLVIPMSGGGTASSVAMVAIAVAIWGNCVLNKQNELIVEQNQIANASRVSAAFSNRIGQLEAELFQVPANEPLPLRLQIEIISWCRSLEPYEMPDSSGKLSPERGRLLRALIDSPADTIDTVAQADFTNADLRIARFRARKPVLTDAHLREANLNDARLSGAVLDMAFLYEASLKGAILDGANLSDADLRHADLEGADLRNAVLTYTKLDDANLAGVKLQGALVHREDWIEYLLSLKQPVRGLDKNAWESVPTDEPDRFRIQSAE